jgi:hypothetical protein
MTFRDQICPEAVRDAGGAASISQCLRLAGDNPWLMMLEKANDSNLRNQPSNSWRALK